jgi:hypothetical protein
MDGNLQNVPNITGADIQRSMQMYGLYPEYVRGKLTRKVVS